MDWRMLLCDQRVGRTQPAGYSDECRSEFERDYDRVVFSSAFRRLQDKTQVFPLSKNDFTRTRLTHSVEVSCVGRSLGRRVGRFLSDENRLPHTDRPPAVTEFDIGSIVAAACLAHDIGNPPFGHSGEAAIQAWARQSICTTNEDNHPNTAKYIVDSEQQAEDLKNFEGNAQALRVLTRLQSNRRKGGMQLTHATLGAMMKYPCGSTIGAGKRDESRVEQKKFGYFYDDSEMINQCLRRLGMIECGVGAYRRHPLAFLVEAADDICYAIVDLEDSVDQKIVRHKKASRLLEPLAMHVEGFRNQPYCGDERLKWLRAYAIHALTVSCADEFKENYDAITRGAFNTSLVRKSRLASEYRELIEYVRNTVYVDRRVLEVELAGFRVIGGLLGWFVEALSHPADGESKKLVEFIPSSYLRIPPGGSRSDAIEALSTYQRILTATDYVSGMTDSFAVELFQKISGIRMPS